MARHPIKHQINTGVLHFGLLTDKQVGPAVFLALMAMGLFVIGGSLLIRMTTCLLLLLPIFVMVLDNQSGGLLQRQVRAWIDFNRSPGVYDPGAPKDLPGYVLLDPEQEARDDAVVGLADLHE